jgi:hypothetical protein
MFWFLDVVPSPTGGRPVHQVIELWQNATGFMRGAAVRKRVSASALLPARKLPKRFTGGLLISTA